MRALGGYMNIPGKEWKIDFVDEHGKGKNSRRRVRWLGRIEE